MVICFGGVCVPLNLLLPFLIGLLHRYGFFKWFKTEWVTLRYWQNRWGEKNAKDIQQVEASVNQEKSGDLPPEVDKDAAEAWKADPYAEPALGRESRKAR